MRPDPFHARDTANRAQNNRSAPREKPETARQVGGVVASVEPGSIADECGIVPGDMLLSIDGNPLRDIIDYRFLVATPKLTLVFGRGDEEHQVEVEKDWSEGLGIEFEEPLFDGTRTCRNRCIFCFVGNLPKGLRAGLYIRDDDYRLSFLFGNFVTLTNLGKDDLLRIEQQRLSPLYVSVHAADRKLRSRLLGTDAPDVLEQIDELGKRQTEVHAQVVLCPGINDGAALVGTIEALALRHPIVRSVAVVPVGLTRFSRTPGVRTLRPEEARQVVEQVAPLQRRFRQKLGRSFVHLSDEFYTMSAAPIPPARWYDGYPQLENGVGMVRRLLTGWANTKRRLPIALRRPRLVGWICGTSAYPTLLTLAADMSRVDGLRVEVCPVANEFFGTTVTVSGLLTSADVVPALRGRRVDQWVLPRAMFDDSGVRTLDGVSLDEMRREAPDPVAVAGSPKELMQLTVFGE